jgi:hypothetical protein
MLRHAHSFACLVALAIVAVGCGTADTETDTGTTPSSGGTDAGSTASGGANFSFFVTSLRALQQLSGNQNGFGGDLRFGETGPGSGLRGADKICATIAERSLPGASAKTWRAFLSATDDGTGRPVHAIERIGTGPWYDRVGRLLAPNIAGLLNERPQGGDAAIANDFPNEDGVPNHAPNPVEGPVDNHDMLTGTNNRGQLYSATATCLDWTSSSTDVALTGQPRVGHSWPRGGGTFPGGGGPGGGGPGGGGPGGSANNWMSSLDESGCAPGVNLLETGPPNPRSSTVGSGGGYGGFYCFALNP